MKGYEYQSDFAKKYVAQGEARGARRLPRADPRAEGSGAVGALAREGDRGRLPGRGARRAELTCAAQPAAAADAASSLASLGTPWHSRASDVGQTSHALQRSESSASPLKRNCRADVRNGRSRDRFGPALC